MNQLLFTASPLARRHDSSAWTKHTDVILDESAAGVKQDLQFSALAGITYFKSPSP